MQIPTLRSPAFALTVIVLIVVVYMYFVHRDLQAHNRYIFDLQKRVEALNQMVSDGLCCCAPKEESPKEEEDTQVPEEDELTLLMNDSTLDPPSETATLSDLRAFLKAHDVNARGSREVLVARVEALKNSNLSLSPVKKLLRPQKRQMLQMSRSPKGTVIYTYQPKEMDQQEPVYPPSLIGSVARHTWIENNRVILKTLVNAVCDVISESVGNDEEIGWISGKLRDELLAYAYHTSTHMHAAKHRIKD